jgi:hypothetical protein
MPITYTAADGTVYNFTLLSSPNVKLDSITNNTGTINIPGTFIADGTQTTYTTTQIGYGLVGVNSSGLTQTIQNPSIIASITLPITVTSLLDYAFSYINTGSKNLSITIPSSIATAAANTFAHIQCGDAFVTCDSSAINGILYSSTFLNATFTENTLLGGQNILASATGTSVIFENSNTITDTTNTFMYLATCPTVSFGLGCTVSVGNVANDPGSPSGLFTSATISNVSIGEYSSFSFARLGCSLTNLTIGNNITITGIALTSPAQIAATTLTIGTNLTITNLSIGLELVSSTIVIGNNATIGDNTFLTPTTNSVLTFGTNCTIGNSIQTRTSSTIGISIGSGTVIGNDFLNNTAVAQSYNLSSFTLTGTNPTLSVGENFLTGTGGYIRPVNLSIIIPSNCLISFNQTFMGLSGFSTGTIVSITIGDSCIIRSYNNFWNAFCMRNQEFVFICNIVIGNNCTFGPGSNGRLFLIKSVDTLTIGNNFVAPLSSFLTTIRTMSFGENCSYLGNNLLSEMPAYPISIALSVTSYTNIATLGIAGIFGRWNAVRDANVPTYSLTVRQLPANTFQQDRNLTKIIINSLNEDGTVIFDTGAFASNMVNTGTRTIETTQIIYNQILALATGQKPPSRWLLQPIITLPAPTSLVVVPGGGSLTVSWVSVANTTTFTVRDYILIFTNTNTLVVTTTSVNKIGGDSGTGGVAYSTVQTNLDSGSSYTVSVSAHCVSSFEYTGPRVSSQGNYPYGPVPAPFNVTASLTVSQAVTLSWAAPNANGNIIITYSIYQYSDASGLNLLQLYSGVTSPYTITGLTNQTPYYFAIGAAGDRNTTLAKSQPLLQVIPLPFPLSPLQITSTSCISVLDAQGAPIKSITTSYLPPIGGPSPVGYAADINLYSVNPANGNLIYVSTAEKQDFSSNLTGTYIVPNTNATINSYVYTINVYAYTGTSTNPNYSPAITSSVKDIAAGLGYWLDGMDYSVQTYSTSRSIGTNSYSVVSKIQDKSGKGCTAITSSIGTSPIFIGSLTPQILNDMSGSYDPVIRTNYNTWSTAVSAITTTLFPNKVPCLMFRSSQIERLTTTIRCQGSPANIFGVWLNMGNGSVAGTTDNGAQMFVDNSGYYGAFYINNTGISSTNTQNQASSISSFVVRSGYDTTSNFVGALNGTPYGTGIGQATGISSLQVNSASKATDVILCELLYYYRDLSFNEVQMIEGYLASRWGLRDQLPADHPYGLNGIRYPGIIQTTPAFYSNPYGVITATNAVYQNVSTGSVTGFSNYLATSNPGPQNAAISLRAAIQTVPPTLALRGSSKSNALTSLLTYVEKDSGGTDGFVQITGTTNTNGYINTLDSVSTTNPPNPNYPVYLVVPKYSNGSSPFIASVNLATQVNGTSYASYIRSGTAYVHFELPISVAGAVYNLTLINDASSITISYNGTVLTDGTNTYTANNSLIIGDLTYPIIGLGSLGGGGGNGGGGGGGGDGGDGGNGAVGSSGAIVSSLERLSQPVFLRGGAVDYTDPKNRTYGFWDSKGRFIFNQDLSGEYISPASMPNYPIRQGGDISQIISNTGNRTLFNALNAQTNQVNNNQRSWAGPVFKSHQDLMRYIQAQYTQPIPGTPQAGTNYNTGTLFPR